MSVHCTYTPAWQHPRSSYPENVVDPGHDPGEEPPVDGPAEGIPRVAGLPGVQVGDEDVVADVDGVCSQPGLEVLEVAIQQLAHVVKLCIEYMQNY